MPFLVGHPSSDDSAGTFLALAARDLTSSTRPGRIHEAAEERRDAQEEMREGDMEGAREEMGEAREEMREAGTMPGDTMMMTDTMPL